MNPRMSGPEVLIIGGGVMGCGIALRLAQAGAQVTVLERSIPGAEASSAAGGILAPQKEAHGPGPLLDMCLKSRAMYPAFAEELRALSGVDIQYAPSGLLNVAFTEQAAHALEATSAWQKALGLRAELLDNRAARELEPELSPKALAVLHLPDDHQLDSRLLVRALSMAAARAGAQFRTGYVRGIASEGGKAVGVDLDGEVLRADAVVIAAGSWSGLVAGSGIDPQLVRPARGQMVELQARLPLFKHVLFGDRGYLVPRADGRILAGSTMEFAGFDKQVTPGGLARIIALAMDLVPALEHVQVNGFWAGLRPYTEDLLPFVGKGPLEGLFLATGHFRNGILMTPITAKVMAQLVLGERPAVDLTPFRWDRPRPETPAFKR